MMMKRLHLFVSGRVQGVCYRAATRDTARGLNLTGWVRNLADGRVEAVFEGAEPNLRRILAWCGEGPPGARPGGVDAEWEMPRGEFETFEIRYGNDR